MGKETTALVAGIAMIVFAVCLVIFVAGRADLANDPFDQTNAAEFLKNIEDGKEATRVGFGAGIVIDGLVVLVVAATAYDLFRDRSHWLAALTVAGLVANAAFSGIADALGIVLTFVAGDYVNGSASGIVAGDPGVLETGRAMGMMLVMLTQVQITAFSLGELALGLLLAFAPSGDYTPPRGLGWLAIASAVAGYLSWTVFAAGVFLIFPIINTVGTLVLLLGLGGWLIMNRRPAET